MTDTAIISRRLVLDAQRIANKLPDYFLARNLKPAFNRCHLTNIRGMLLLIVALDTSVIGDHTNYTTTDLLHQISTELGGMKVYLSNTTGIRYVVVITGPQKLPKNIELPADIPTGMVALGMRPNGKSLILSWARLGHIMVAGITGSGKSSILQVIIHQAIRDGHLIAISDIDQTTFPMLAHHPSLISPIAASTQDTIALMHMIKSICEERAKLYEAIDGYPKSIDEYNTLSKTPLQRVVVVIDETPSVIASMGGNKDDLKNLLAEIVMRGRKFGINIVFSSQDLTKEMLGPIRDQINLSIAFRLRQSSLLLAKKIGCEKATQIPASRPGLAIVERHGPIQSYYVPKSLMVAAGASNTGILTNTEKHLIEQARSQDDGKLTINNIMDWGGLSQNQARRLQRNWSTRGWIVKDANRDNSYCLTPKLLDIATNHQAQQTTSNPDKPLQTTNQGEQNEITK